MIWGWFTRGLIFATVLFMSSPCWAAHPLITDDAGTQGKGKFQVELNGQYDWDREETEGVTVKTTGGRVSATLSYGIMENLDLVLGLPYLRGKEREDNVTVYNENGIGDATLEVKWRFFEKNGLSLAIKPGISFPTGNDDKGLGTGKIGGSLFFIASQEVGPWAFHGNLGYGRNENNFDERRDIWHASLATTWEVIKDLKLVANIGIERNPDDEANEDPGFIIGGIIYSINEHFDIDLGVKRCLTGAETDISALAGITMRF